MDSKEIGAALGIIMNQNKAYKPKTKAISAVDIIAHIRDLEEKLAPLEGRSLIDHMRYTQSLEDRLLEATKQLQQEREANARLREAAFTGYPEERV